MIIVARAKFVARCCDVATQNANAESMSRKSVQRFSNNDLPQTNLKRGAQI
jgi:hypothetical protein